METPNPSRQAAIASARQHPEAPRPTTPESTEVRDSYALEHPIEILTPDGPLMGYLTRFNGKPDGGGEIVFRLGKMGMEREDLSFTTPVPDDLEPEVESALHANPDAQYPNADDLATDMQKIIETYDGMRISGVDAGHAWDYSTGNSYQVLGEKAETTQVRPIDRRIGENPIRTLLITEIL